MRYCKDCAHFELPNMAVGGAPICARFKKEFVISEHPVYGPRMGFSAPECSVAREEKGQCGPQARFYEARPGSEAWLAEREEKKEAVFAEAHEELETLRRVPWWKFWA